MPRKRKVAAQAAMSDDATTRSQSDLVDRNAPPKDEPTMEKETAEFEERDDAPPEQKTFAPTLSKDNIDIGDGRRIAFALNRRFFQNQIAFRSKDGKNEKPEQPDFKWLEDRNWKWREEEVAFTKQLQRSTEVARFARSHSDRHAHGEFLELANTIRSRAGLHEVTCSAQAANKFVRD